MKKMFALLALTICFSAQASYFEENCSDPDGEIRWEEGHNTNEIYFRTFIDGERKIVSFSRGEVEIKLTDKKTIMKKSVREACYAASEHLYYSSASITPDPEIAEEFKKIFPTGKAQAHVLCHFRNDYEMECKR